MEPNVIKEMQALQTMVLNWKSSYLSMRAPDGGDEFLADEFREEITTHVSPFVRRLHDNCHLSAAEAQAFLNDCYSQVEDLRKLLIEGNGGG